MKRCAKCKLEKSLESYNKNKTRKDGHQSICRVCSNKNSTKYYNADPKTHRERVSKLRQKIINWLNVKKSTLKCEICNENHISCLQFHHLKDKKFTIGHAINLGYSIPKIEIEIAKCKVLCANCHFKLHWHERNI